MVFTRPRSPAAMMVVPVLLILMIIYVMRSPGGGQAVNVVVSNGRSNLEAIYKCAYENKDGTVDLVFNIPRGGQDLLNLHKKLSLDSDLSKQLGGRLNVTSGGSDKGVTPASSDGKPAGNGNGTNEAGKMADTKTLYPISLDADYVINSVMICPKGQPVDYIVLVHSATAYFQRRRIIRETFGGQGVFSSVVQRIVFLLGTTTDPITTRKIREEAVLHKDIVQGDFADSYHNLTHKGVMGLRWVAEYCPQANLVIKIDDDVFMNPFRVVKYVLPEFSKKNKTIACHVRPRNTSPIVRGKGKWQVRETEFSGYKNYPFDYCNGYFVILTPDLVKPMLKAARMTPFFWIDDVYLFGLLPNIVGYTHFENIKRNLTLRLEKGQVCLNQLGTDCPFVGVSQWVQSKAESLWYKTLANMTSEAKEEMGVFQAL